MPIDVASQSQLDLFDADVSPRETPRYYRDQLITYLGNKRSLLGPIAAATGSVAAHLKADKLRILDGFAGSGVVSRLFKSYASDLVVNDIESYSRVISNCFLTNASSVDMTVLNQIVDRINARVDNNVTPDAGFIERLYAPRHDDCIQNGERVFYTRDNARRLDAYRRLIGFEPQEWFELLLGPLLSSASVNTNTAGVFKGFYKDRVTGKGKFGGTGADALQRIRQQIRLRPPILSKYDTKTTVLQQDINTLISNVGDFDLAYFDPPYNQHPYGSNYFMLNLLVDYAEPQVISRVSGIPVNWKRSLYNQKRSAFQQLSRLIQDVDARYVLLSFNDEGFISPKSLRALLHNYGPVKDVKLKYNTFRGSRNLQSRSTHVTEHLYLLEKLGR